MKSEIKMLLIEEFLSKALGENVLTSGEIIKFKESEEVFFIESRTLVTNNQQFFSKNKLSFFENLLNIDSTHKNIVIIHISVFEFIKLSNYCKSLQSIIKEINTSLIIIIQEFHTFDQSVKISFTQWSSAFGLAFSQHPNWPRVILVDFEYRFHERSGVLSRYEEIMNHSAFPDENHQGVWHFRMKDELVKRFLVNEIYLLEALRDLNNFKDIYSRWFDFSPNEFNISCDDTGIFIRRPFIVGESLNSFLLSNPTQTAAKLLLRACCQIAKSKYFPNDLRPWNLIFQTDRCLLIDFPKNIHIDDDVDGVSNFIALLATLEFIREAKQDSFYNILSKILYNVCNHAEIYNFESYSKLEFAWLNLDKYIELLLLFESGKVSVETILNEVFDG